MRHLLHVLRKNLIHQRRSVHVAADRNRIQSRHQVGRGHAAQFGFVGGHLRCTFCSSRPSICGGWFGFSIAPRVFVFKELLPTFGHSTLMPIADDVGPGANNLGQLADAALGANCGLKYFHRSILSRS